MEDLIVIEKKAGLLTTNIEQLEVFVSEKLSEYTPDLYKGDADAAKKDRAELNKSLSFLKESRIKVIAEMMKPFKDFEERCKKLEKDILSASSALDVIVKAREEAEKARKKQAIADIWARKHFDLVSLEAVFVEKWLNKTTKLKDVETDIDSAIKKIYTDIKTIEQFASDDVETLKALYLETLDMGCTMERAAVLKTNRERIAKEAIERAEREHNAQILAQKIGEGREENKAIKSQGVASLASMALEVEVDTDPVQEYCLRFKVKRSVLMGLRNYMSEHGIEYTKEV